MLIGFAIGNGTSRIGFDYSLIDGIGTTVGCNQIHDDYSPDIVVSLDSEPLKRIHEIPDRDFALMTWDDDRENIEIEGTPVMGYADVNEGYSFNSGIIACSYLAKVEKVEKLYMIGFDFFRLIPGMKTNEIGTGQLVRGLNVDTAFNKLFVDCPDTEFIRVGPIHTTQFDFFFNRMKNVTYQYKYPRGNDATIRV